MSTRSIAAVWVVAAAACFGLGAAALQKPVPHRPDGLRAGPLFSLRPGITGAVPADAQRVTVTLTDAGCQVSPTVVAPGPTTFVVVNPGNTAAEETELRYGTGSRILGEAEDVDPGASQLFSAVLEAGSYNLACPGTAAPATVLTVAGGAVSGG